MFPDLKPRGSNLFGANFSSSRFSSRCFWAFASKLLFARRNGSRSVSLSVVVMYRWQHFGPCQTQKYGCILAVCVDLCGPKAALQKEDVKMQIEWLLIVDKQELFVILYLNCVFIKWTKTYLTWSQSPTLVPSSLFPLAPQLRSLHHFHHRTHLRPSSHSSSSGWQSACLPWSEP